MQSLPHAMAPVSRRLQHLGLPDKRHEHALNARPHRPVVVQEFARQVWVTQELHFALVNDVGYRGHRQLIPNHIGLHKLQNSWIILLCS